VMTTKTTLTLAFAALLACQTPCPTPTPTAAPSAHVLAFPGPFPRAAAQGGVPFYGDGGFPVVLPAGDAGQTLFSGGPGANPYFGATPTLTVSALAIPGTVTAPPTVASTTFSFVNNATHPTTATDITFLSGATGISFQVPANGTAGNGYVRPCIGSPSCSSTMSVEVGIGCIDPFQTVSGTTEQVGSGAMLYESGSGKWLDLYVLHLYTSGNASQGTALFVIGSNYNGGTGVEYFGVAHDFAYVFVRMRISGSTIVPEASIDKQVWAPVGSAITTTAAFTTTPNEVGVALYGTSIPIGGTEYVTLYDFVTN
jgi:hypothetical protein